MSSLLAREVFVFQTCFIGAYTSFGWTVSLDELVELVAEGKGFVTGK